MPLQLIQGGKAEPASTRDGPVTRASLRKRISRVMPKVKLPQRPPPPKEPRSLFVPIALGVIALFAVVVVPVFTAEAEPEAEEAAAAEPEEVVVTLTVRTEPQGATVYVGDEEKGETPLDLEVPAEEELTLRIEREGFATVERTLTPELGMEPLDVALETAGYVLVLEGLPEGAAVTVNDEAVEDPSEIELGESLEEAVAVAIEAEGYRPFTAEVGADAFEDEAGRKVHTLAVELSARPGRAAGSTTRAAASTTRAASPTTATAMAPAPEPTPEPAATASAPAMSAMTPSAGLAAPPDNPF